MEQRQEATYVCQPDGSDVIGLRSKMNSSRAMPSGGEDVGAAIDDAGASAKAGGLHPGDPFREFDAIALAEMNRMREEDAVYKKTHPNIDQDYNRMQQQDVDAFAKHETYVTVNARRDPRDAALCTVVEAHDLPLQSAVAAQAAGPNPIAPRDAALLPTPGMDWLERMKATDEALQKSIGKHDAVLSNPSG